MAISSGRMDRLQIRTDNDLIVRAFETEMLINKWIENDWRNSKGLLLANLKEIQRLNDLIDEAEDDHDMVINFKHVYARSCIGNDRAEDLALEVAREYYSGGCSVESTDYESDSTAYTYDDPYYYDSSSDDDY